MKTKNILGGLAIFTLVVLFACKTSPYKGYKQADTGLYYQFFKQDEKGAKPKEGDIVKIRLEYKTNKDSVLFDSKKITKTGGVLEFPLTHSTFKGSFEDALLMMSIGDSASFILNADSIFLKTFKQPAVPAFAKGTMLTFNTTLIGIKSKDEAQKEQSEMMQKQKEMGEQRKSQEPLELSQYLEKNKIITNPTASGLYYIEKVKGKGEKVQPGKMVKVHYKGMLLNGTVFDSSIDRGQPAEFPIGTGTVIRGWDEGIPMMNVGGKATLIIPSSLAYGEAGAQGAIPPYASLVFEVEVLGVKDAPATQQQQAPQGH